VGKPRSVKRRVVPDRYNELRVELKHGSGKLMYLEVPRVQRGGGAALPRFRSKRDKSGFSISQASAPNFGSRTTHSDMKSTERKAEYRRARIADIQAWCERPLTLEFAGGLFASLAEAGNQRYPRMLLSGMTDHSGLVSAARMTDVEHRARGGTSDGHVTLSAGESTPLAVLVRR